MIARVDPPWGRAMPETRPKRIAYLFGAGATHAELITLIPTLTSEDKIQRKAGLLISHVSTRVIARAGLTRHFLKGVEFLEPRYLDGVEIPGGSFGALNIELLISLIENCKVHQWERKTRLLKSLVQKDIQTILSPSRRARFYLHKALCEFHEQSGTKDREEVIGFISLNYDSVLDEAYREFYGKQNYCFSRESGDELSNHIPLLKLHGSFNWTRGVTIRERIRKIEIIPLGSNKNYLHPPYNFIWSQALEILVRCDTLRIIGCSLSQNDTHLVDLLFKTHLERAPSDTISIEIINSEESGETIRKNYGFFPGIRTLTKIENLVANPDPPSAFKAWLEAKADATLGAGVKSTRYLKRLKR